jgi:5-methylcytosine-specific restriction endonuclease McrA
MTKKDRQIIYDKYDGHCAYCGCKLEKGWHIDELMPCKRKYRYVQGYWQRSTGEQIVSLGLMPDGDKAAHYNHVKAHYVQDGCEFPERLVIENQMPACASCNINKHSLDLEEFRSLIEGFMKHLNELNTQYKIAKRYGLVKEDIKPIIFYFEKLK